jgi:1-acyl-sn-glycerol-3-phosphate acyltransferase
MSISKKLINSNPDIIVQEGTDVNPSEESLRFKKILDNINNDLSIPYINSVIENLISFIDKFYFRSKIINPQNASPKRVQPDRPLIFASNHSGMTFPWDGITMAGKIFLHNNKELKKSVRPIVAPMLSQSVYMEPFMIENFWKRLGGVDATLENFEAVMHTNEANIMIYPEGVPGIAKGFDHRYQIQNVSSSFIRMALKFKTDIIPIATINGEYLNPYSYRNDELNKLVNKIGMPFLPLGPLTGLAFLYPWAFYFAMPAKLTYVFGEPIKLYEIIDTPFHKIKKKEINKIREIVKDKMQNLLDMGLQEHGKDPFDWKELAELWFENKDKLFYILPSGWPILFSEHERLFKESNGEVKMEYTNDAFLHSVKNNFSQSPFLLPVAGWPILLKSKGIF